MQSFTTHGPDHKFQVDKGFFYMRGFTAADFLELPKMDALEDEEKVEAFQTFMAVRARRRWFEWRNPQRAVRDLGPVNLRALFDAWIGKGEAVPGEEGSSPE